MLLCWSGMQAQRRPSQRLPTGILIFVDFRRRFALRTGLAKRVPLSVPAAPGHRRVQVRRIGPTEEPAEGVVGLGWAGEALEALRMVRVIGGALDEGDEPPVAVPVGVGTGTARERFRPAQLDAPGTSYHVGIREMGGRPSRIGWTARNPRAAHARRLDTGNREDSHEGQPAMSPVLPQPTATQRRVELAVLGFIDQGPQGIVLLEKLAFMSHFVFVKPLEDVPREVVFAD